MTSSDDETRPFLPARTKQARLPFYLATALLGATVIAGLVVTSANLSLSQKSYDQIAVLANKSEPIKPDIAEIPASYAIPTRVSVRNQGRRGTCWDFATMRYVETQYQKQGEELGYLKTNDYVGFSEYAYGKSLIAYCRQNPKKCPDTPQAYGNATDGYANWLYLFYDYLHDKLVVDMPTCQYTALHGSDEQCGKYDEFINASTIDYKVASHTVYYKVDEIKRALAQERRPLLLTVELYRYNYYVPCEPDFGYKNTTECTEKVHLCPQSLQTDGFNRYCVKLDRLASLDASFALNNTQTTYVSAHVLLLVGYNERGLVLHNSWGSQLSHSLRYLMSEISSKDDALLCTNTQDPRLWVPIDHSLNYYYKLRNTTILKYVQGGFQPTHVDISSRDTIARAMDAIFNESHYYAVDTIEQSVDDTVRITFGVSKSVRAAIEGTFDQRVQSPPMAFEDFSYFFEPQGITDQVKSSSDECGFYEISYDYIKFVQANNGAFFADDMPIEFAPESYAAKMEAGFVRDMVEKATFSWAETPFSNSSPWQDDDSWTPRWR